MSLIFLISLIIFNIVLGLLVFTRSRTKTNYCFLSIIISSTLWAIFVYFSDLKFLEHNYLLLLNRLTFTAASILVLSLLLFAYYFPFEIKKIKPVLYIIIPLAVVVIPLTLTGLVVDGIVEKSWGWDISTGSLYSLYLLYFGVGITAAFVIFIYKYIKSSAVYKVQLRYIFFGTFLTAIIASVTNLLLPLLTNSNPFAKYGPFSLVIFLSVTTYAIAKHRLMDIRFVVARSVAYMLVLVVLAGFYAGSVLGIERIFFPSSFDKIDLVQGGIRTVLAVIMAFTFQPLRKWITKRTDSIFFKNAYNPEKLLDRFSHTLSSTIVLVDLLYKVSDIMIQDMKVSRVLFVLLKDQDRIYTHLATGYKETPELKIENMRHFAKEGTVVYDELEENSHDKTLLRHYDASAVIPLKTEKETVGIMMLGEKSSGDMYSQQDLRILEIIAPEIAIAVENAKSFEEINRFNITLRNEVNRATKRLKEKNEELRELDTAKDEFISMASHQLRTPLTAIKGYLSMLLDGDAGEIKIGQYDFIHEAYSGANRMVGLINDLLNVSRMETGRFFIEATEVDLVQAVQEEARQYDSQAKDKGLILKLDLKKVPHVWVDEIKMRQVIMNLIDNAIHYTNKGGVTVKLYKTREDIVYEVEDTGIGVPTSQQPALFEKFYRADNARHVRPDGTGLGIYLAKRVVQDHGGTIIFHSEEGQGSTFGFRLPLKVVTKKPSTNVLSPKVKKAVVVPHKPAEPEVEEKPKEVMDEPVDIKAVADVHQ